MTRLIFATNNANKVTELQSAVGNVIEVISLRDAGIDIDIPEPFDTLEANATQKSKTIYEMTGVNCFSEDTGLEVESLGGEPGVKSARYAGENRSFEKNIEKLLNRLQNQENRKARFRTVISLLWEGKEYLFDGICEGVITKEEQGTRGFGYDPVFSPSGTNRTFGEMELEEKNQFSHRRKAADKLVSFLKEKTGGAGL